MAVIIEMAYGKKLGLPEYSSHNFNVKIWHGGSAARSAAHRAPIKAERDVVGGRSRSPP